MGWGMKYIENLFTFNGYSAFGAMSDPFSNAHRANEKAAERKAEQEKTTQETIARNARFAARAEKPKTPKPYTPTRPFWSPR